MAIDRGPWNALVDDDGSNLVGSIWNKAAIKTVVLDPVDAALVTPTYGSFTPNDASGAGLVLTGLAGGYAKIGRVVHVWIDVTYPTTANAANAAIGGLPFPASIVSGGTQAFGVARQYYLGAGVQFVQVLNPTTGGFLTNANMTGARTTFTVTYLTT